MRFNRGYFFITLALFIVEVMIAMFFHDEFIRPYVGDYLVVVLMYCFIRSFFTFSVKHVAISVLLFSYSIEVLQHFDFVHRLGLTNSKLANLILGNYFEWGDLLAYTLGILTVVTIEVIRIKKVFWGNDKNRN